MDVHIRLFQETKTCFVCLCVYGGEAVGGGRLTGRMFVCVRVARETEDGQSLVPCIWFVPPPLFVPLCFSFVLSFSLSAPPRAVEHSKPLPHNLCCNTLRCHPPTLHLVPTPHLSLVLSFSFHPSLHLT